MSGERWADPQTEVPMRLTKDFITAILVDLEVDGQKSLFILLAQDGTAHQRDGHGVGAHAVARSAAGRVGGVEEGQ